MNYFNVEVDRGNKVIKIYRSGSDEPELVITLDEAPHLIKLLAEAWHLYRHL